MKSHSFPGKFIVVEGLDASGKATQAELLANRFKSTDHNVKKVEFPAYKTEFGQLVRNYLDGKLGEKEELPPEIRSLLYSLDRYQFKHEFADFLANGGVLVSDRFSQSNYAFQSATAENSESMTEWMKAVDSRLPQPDEIIFLDVPPEVTAGMMAERRKDIHESDIEYQKKVYERYLELAEQGGWTVIDCVDEGELRPIEAIHEDIWSKVSELDV